MAVVTSKNRRDVCDTHKREAKCRVSDRELENRIRIVNSNETQNDGGTTVRNWVSVQTRGLWFANIRVSVNLRDAVQHFGLKLEN